MFHFVVAIPCLIVIFRYLIPLKWPLWFKFLLSAVLLFVAQHHLLTLLAFGSMFSPEVPRVIVLAVNWIFGTMLFLAVLQIAVDLIVLMLMVFKRRRIAIPPVLRYSMGALALGVAAFAVSQAARVPAVKDIEVAIQGLPAEFDGYEIVQLTDLHISRLFEAPWVEAVVAQANALEPNLIVITGDLIDGDLDVRRTDVAPLQALSAPDGVYTIPGNHEYYFGYPQWIEHYQTLGMQVLANQHVAIENEGANLVLAGVTDFTAGRHAFPAPNVEEAIAGAPDDAPIIMLDHQPRNAAVAAAAGVDLQLSGHTHGGMIVGFDRLVARANNGFVSGFYDVQEMALYVNNGTGLWPGFALRLGKPSELTRITLRQG
ncbi:MULTISPECIES: metallophosphoesterase [Halomonadaceae]|uniref:Metallophosphoesterase n=1 Tax=Vreelandella titanicae TaxID=664683 RepID=A0A558JEW8_9GAMM|nr:MULTISPECIES: metallophosphoesterase [Halomonas]MBR9905646.1 metallophosphoesterase [Gammaproteobacteria bacterium]TVU92184.1 metallophosphoesterase [Halomonas titanicae]CEP33859.1 Ser/Thr protein phosphatase family protein [Halomonas sp. R57-5]